jgi:hypothetical protein
MSAIKLRKGQAVRSQWGAPVTISHWTHETGTDRVLAEVKKSKDCGSGTLVRLVPVPACPCCNRDYPEHHPLGDPGWIDSEYVLPRPKKDEQ